MSETVDEDSTSLIERVGAQSEPHRGLAYVLTILPLTLFVCQRAFGFDFWGLTYGWWVATASFLPFLLLSLLLSIRGPAGVGLTVFAVLGLVLGGGWYVASAEVFRAQSRALMFSDLSLWWSDPGRRAVVLGFVVEGPLLVIVAVTVLVYLGIARFLRRFASTRLLVAQVLLVAGLIIPSGFVRPQDAWVLRDPEAPVAPDEEPSLAERYAAQASAPWSSIHDPWDDLERPFDMDAAKAFSERASPPAWTPEPDPILSPLRGLYAGRSIVLVIMESQRASNTGILGPGAYQYEDVTPNLNRLASDGLLFTNYFASGLPTDSALWSIGTGLPEAPAPGGLFAAPHAAKVGRMPHLQKLGYKVEWIRAAHPSCQNWSTFLGEIGVKYWIDSSETDPLDKTWWNIWGMPDDQLYGIGLQRLAQARAAKKPDFLLILTSSNHDPFRFPPDSEGNAFRTDFLGGMRFADDRMAKFIEEIRKIPEPERPIVFLTADTSSFYGLSTHPMGQWAMEATRIPGLLLLPDGKMAGVRHDGTFVHDDLLDLLLMLVAPPSEPISDKFVKAKRAGAIARSPHLIITPKTYFGVMKGTVAEIRGPWELVHVARPSDPDLILGIQGLLREYLEKVWLGGE